MDPVHSSDSIKLDRIVIHMKGKAEEATTDPKMIPKQKSGGLIKAEKVTMSMSRANIIAVAGAIKRMEKRLKAFKLLLHELLKSEDDNSEAIQRMERELEKFKLFVQAEKTTEKIKEMEENLKEFKGPDKFIKLFKSAADLVDLVKRMEEKFNKFKQDIQLLKSGDIKLLKSGDDVAEAIERMGEKLNQFKLLYQESIAEKSLVKASHGLESGSSASEAVTIDIKKKRKPFKLSFRKSPIKLSRLESGSSASEAVTIDIKKKRKCPIKASHGLESGPSASEAVTIDIKEELNPIKLIEEQSDIKASPEALHGVEIGPSSSSEAVTIGMEEESHFLRSRPSTLVAGTISMYKAQLAQTSTQCSPNKGNITASQESNRTGRWEIQRSIVLGGLIESITSLAILTSAANANISDGNIITLALTNLITGLFIVRHNLSGVERKRVEKRCSRAGLEGSHYQQVLREKLTYLLYFTIAFLSFLFSGLVAPLVYALSFHGSGNKNLKILTAAGASLSCTAFFAIQKAHIQKPTSWLVYVKTATVYVSVGVGAFGLSYIAGYIFGQLMDKLSWVQ